MPIQLRKKIREAKLLINKGSYFEIVHRFCSRYLPSWLILIGKSDLLEFCGDKVELKRKPKNIVLQKAGINDLPEILECYDALKDELTERLYRGYFNEGRACYTIRYKGKIGGYIWAFLNTYRLTYDDYRLSNVELNLDKNTAFFGDGYIHPSHRLRGFFPIIIKEMIEDLNTSKSINRFLAHIEPTNEHSYKSHSRIGFNYIKTYYFISILKFKFFFISEEGKNFRFNRRNYSA